VNAPGCTVPEYNAAATETAPAAVAMNVVAMVHTLPNCTPTRHEVANA
jgi:hypothetical protein